MIEINDLSYGTELGEILKDISVAINDGELIGLIGPSGAGKTVFLRILSGITTGYRGDIIYSWPETYAGKAKPVRAHLFTGTLPQNLEDTLYHYLLLSRTPYKKVFSPFSEYDLQVVDRYVDAFGLRPLAETKLSLLSHSAMTAALLARSFIREPYALYLDTPATLCDIKTRNALLKSLKKYVMDGNRTAVIASDDLTFVCQAADRVFIMAGGTIAKAVTPRDLDAKTVKDYFGVDVIVSKNIYNGRPEFHLFPEE